MIVRPATRADSEAIREIERSAGERFKEIGMDWVAAHEPISAEELGTFADAGRSWVAVGDDVVQIGYVIVDEVEGCAHIEQLSVALRHQGRGIGRALLDRVEHWAGAHGLGAVTLTTFTDVSWNRALYEHLGFKVLAVSELSAGLVSIRDAEAKRGLDPATRVCMRKEVGQLA